MELETWIGNNPAKAQPHRPSHRPVGSRRRARRRATHTPRAACNATVARAYATCIVSIHAAVSVQSGSGHRCDNGDRSGRMALHYRRPDSSGSATPPLAGAILSIDDIATGKTGAVYKTANGDAVASARPTQPSWPTYFLIRHPDRCDANRPADNLCLEVARGHEFKIMLVDSTVVCLNSESTLSYPEGVQSVRASCPRDRRSLFCRQARRLAPLSMSRPTSRW